MLTCTSALTFSMHTAYKGNTETNTSTDNAQATEAAETLESTETSEVSETSKFFDEAASLCIIYKSSSIQLDSFCIRQ
ncbi:MAG: hypothetical protein U0K86_10235 [Agathobacter sp.]|nr:hypothetical protein [Agathobacter sp.]